MPPMPGQSRSLLQFTPVKQEYGIAREAAISPAAKVEEEVKMEVADLVVEEARSVVKKERQASPDHDYFGEKSGNFTQSATFLFI